MTQYNFREKTLSLIVVISVSLLSGCSLKWTKVEKIDTDSDGIVDIIRYYKGDFLKRQDLLYFKDDIYKGEITVWRSWNEVDYIEMIPNEAFVAKLKDKTTRDAYRQTLRKFFNKGSDIVVDGESLHVQEVNKAKSFGNFKMLGNSFLFVKDRNKYASKVTDSNGLITNLVFYDSDGGVTRSYEDNNRDGFFDIVVVYTKNQKPSRVVIQLPVDTPLTVLRTQIIRH
jgi:hypothetical protein